MNLVLHVGANNGVEVGHPLLASISEAAGEVLRSIDKIDVSIGAGVGKHCNWGKPSVQSVNVHRLEDEQSVVDVVALVGMPVFHPGAPIVPDNSLVGHDVTILKLSSAWSGDHGLGHPEVIKTGSRLSATLTKVDLWLMMGNYMSSPLGFVLIAESNWPPHWPGLKLAKVLSLR